MRPGRVWNRDELILAIELYFDPDCSHDSRNPRVRELAAWVNRTPASVALKLANFQSMDRAKSGGMPHHGEEDARIWKEFAGRPAELRKAADKSMERIMASNPTADQESRRAI